jgi:hypothetical protein
VTLDEMQQLSLLQTICFACGFFSIASSIALPATVKPPQAETTRWGGGSSSRQVDGSIVGPIFFVNKNSVK